jgi:hypothetical protein
MKNLLLILVVLSSLLPGRGAIVVGEIPTYYTTGKGFYVDKSGVKHEGKLKLYYPIYHENGEVTNRNVVFKGDGEKRELDFDEIKYFVIKNAEYYPIKEFSFTTYSKGNEDLIQEYTIKKVFLNKVTVGRISYSTHSGVIGGGISQRNWDADFIEKEGTIFNLNLCAKENDWNDKMCLLKLINDQPELLEKYKKRSKYTPISEGSMKYMFEEYNGYY